MSLMTWKSKQTMAPYMFISPFLVLFAAFMFFPAISAVRLSFFSWNGVGAMIPVGLGNYARLMRDEIFWQSIINGVVIYFLYVPLMLSLALLLAVILNSKNVPGRKFFRAAFYLPNITSVVAVAFVFLMIFDTRYGFVNLVITSFGGERISWLGTPLGARIVVATVVLWRWTGYNMILLLAGLQGIPKELYEAARIDGASSGAVFFSITVPLVKPIMLFCAVLSCIGTFRLFAEPLLITNGGPMNRTITPVLYIYSETFARLRMGYGAAISVVFFLLMFLFTTIQFRLTRERR